MNLDFQAPDLAAPKKVYTVSELNREIRFKLDAQFPSLWMEGEISNFKYHTSGHMYFSLKDETSQIGVVFFSRYNQQLRFDPKDGMKVLVRGRISVYEPRGQYQVYVEQMIPKGVGELQLAFLQLKEKLEKEGLFDATRKKAIPKFPKVVGVITSPTGAAIRDILNVVHRRFFGTRVLISPVLVQGEGASRQIAQAIRDMNVFGEAEVLIVGRGGGSLEDLWAFNEEIVARAIFTSEIPVISAVGHEIDWTISDLVADLRAPTPSAAAELVVQNREDIEMNLQVLGQRLQRALREKHQRLFDEWETLASSYAFKQPKMLVQGFSQRLDELLRQLQNYLSSEMDQKVQTFESLTAQLENLSPLSILRRGYSVTLDKNKRVIKSKTTVRVGDRITTRLSDGILYSEVSQIKNVEEER